VNTRQMWTGFGLVLIGAILLLNNIGIVPWEYWLRLLNLWPATLIAIGVSLFFNRSVLRYLGPLLLVAVAVVVLYGRGYVPWMIENEKTFAVPVAEEIERATLHVAVGGASLAIGPGSDLVSAHFRYTGAGPDWKVSGSGAERTVHIRGSSGGDLSFLLPRRSTMRAGVHLSSGVIWSLNMNLGAVDLDADLRGIPVRELVLDTGAGNLNIHMGRIEGTGTISIDAGASKIVLGIPQGTSIRLRVDGALVSKEISSLGLIRKEGVWSSPDWDESVSRYDISIASAVSGVQIVRDPPGESGVHI